MLEEASIIRLPKSVGLTGKAIKQRKYYKVMKGEREPGFSQEIDNFHNFTGIRNMLICPIFSPDG